MGSEGDTFFTSGNELIALNQKDGKEIWKKISAGARIITVGKQDTLFVQFADKLINRDTKTGDEKWFIEKIEGTPILCSDDLLLSVPKRQTKRVLRALKPSVLPMAKSCGPSENARRADLSVNSFQVGADGTIYVGTPNHILAYKGTNPPDPEAPWPGGLQRSQHKGCW